MDALRIALVALLLNVFFQNIEAQPYLFSNYTTADGLSNNQVQCIIRDQEGFLWIGTNAGLNRFDGYEFTIYKSIASDTTTLPSNNIMSLLVDDNDNLWITTDKGVCRFNKRKNCFKRIYIHTRDGENLLSAATTDLFLDSKNILWVGVGELGMVRFNKERGCFEETGERVAAEKGGILSILEEPNGVIWTLGYYHITAFNPKKNSYRHFDTRLSKTGENFQALKIFPDQSDSNYLWITTWSDGIVHFNKENGECQSFIFEKSNPKNLTNIIFDVFPHSNSTLWLATNQGIILFDGKDKIFGGLVRDLINDKPVINTQAHCFYKDVEGIIWIGTAWGLTNINPAKQKFVNEPLWLNQSFTKFMYEDDKLYGLRIYADRALYICDTKSKSEACYKIPRADELKAEPFAIQKDNNGLLWIGTTKGIYTFNEMEKKFSFFDAEDQLQMPDRSLYIRNMVKDKAGYIWASCYSKGMLQIDPKNKKVTSFFHENSESFPLDGISGVTLYDGSLIYACDPFRGVVKMDHRGKILTWYNSAQKDYAILEGATDIAVDKNMNIWVTTRNNGLVQIDRSNSATAYIKDDFGNIIDEQQSIVIDDAGKIWITANIGIYQFDPSTKSFTQFTLMDGLPVSTLSDPLYKMPDGTIAYLIIKGIFTFDPLAIDKKRSPLNVHLKSILVNGKAPSFNATIDRLDSIRLQHTENNLAIDFAAIDFSNPSSTLYSYMLEGSDKHWSLPSKRQVVNFSGLNPGTYILNIRAGIQSPVKKLVIQIIPAWWQTAFFKWTMVLLVLVTILVAARFLTSLRYKQQIVKLEQQRQIENIRMRISRDIHDEIGSGLTKIKLMSRNLAKAIQPVELNETTSKISNASDELIQNLGEIVWTINPANDTLENVFAYARNYVAKLFDENSEIKAVIDFTEPSQLPSGIHINPEVKRNLLLILKEALTNVVKHAETKEVYVSMKAGRKEVKMEISDKGVGISPQQASAAGNGLVNMRKRAEAINGDLRIVSNNGGGTVICISVPLQQAVSNPY